ncbi:hypothetical protein GCM10025867_49180 (plasmid) [Frondihabitans sucicola]|uniref:DUF4303 domain-containing protein n=1 Tax=Frondihabitans sucicola TaxID=1268041 RepID=A0ABM8GW28_9MICO|nr:hypothetical protein [Frondihabitans sucicola]BDZ52677.1 hypothetical protein GCM10025867_49180 [Frondihabitans sucicola]
MNDTEITTIETPKPEMDTFEQMTNVVWTAQSARLAAAQNALRATLKAMHPDAHSGRFSFYDEGCPTRLDFEAVLDADGEEIDIDPMVAYDSFMQIGQAYEDHDDAEEWTDRHVQTARFETAYFIENLDERLPVANSFATASAADWNVVLGDGAATDLFELLKVRLGK